MLIVRIKTRGWLANNRDFTQNPRLGEDECNGDFANNGWSSPYGISALAGLCGIFPSNPRGEVVKLNTWSRIVAVACMLASAPLGFLKYPWLPATVMEFAELQHDPAPWGTPSYHEGRAERLARVKLALLLYGLGTISLCGLSAIIAQVLPWWLELLTWGLTALTALAIARFDTPTIAGTDPVYLFAAVHIPAAISAVSALFAIVSLGRQLLHRRSSNLP